MKKVVGILVAVTSLTAYAANSEQLKATIDEHRAALSEISKKSSAPHIGSEERRALRTQARQHQEAILKANAQLGSQQAIKGEKMSSVKAGSTKGMRTQPKDLLQEIRGRRGRTGRAQAAATPTGSPALLDEIKKGVPLKPVAERGPKEVAPKSAFSQELEARVKQGRTGLRTKEQQVPLKVREEKLSPHEQLMREVRGSKRAIAE